MERREEDDVQVVRVDAELEKRWDAYVERSTITVTDLSGWRHVVGQAYGMASYFFAAIDDGVFVGALGLFEVKHPLFGHYLTTAAFSNDGGFYFENREASALLVGEAKRLADDLGVDYLLIRTRGVDLDGFTVDRHYRTAVIDLQGGADVVWEKRLRGNTRNQIRRGLKEGFTVHNGNDQLRAFHRVFHTHMRDLGSPAHGLSFYHAILEHLRERVRFVVVREGRSVVAGGLLFEVNGTAMNIHTVALRQYNRRCPNYLIYWDMIKGSCARGNDQFDMGRSEDDSPNLRFKRHWGARIVGLSYNYYLRNLGEVPYLDPRNPRYRLAISVWRRLPLVVTRALVLLC